MGWPDEPLTLEEALKKVHHLATEASWLRKKVVMAMSDARKLGATDDQLSKVSDLPTNAVRSLLDKYPARHDRRGSA